jgi:hypothetical protein
MVEEKLEIKQENKTATKLEHPSLYRKQDTWGKWIQDAKGNDIFETKTQHYEYDTVMNVWVKNGSIEVKEQNPESQGLLKSMDFIIAYPNDEPKQGRRIKQSTIFLMQKGTIKVKGRHNHVYLLKQERKACGGENSTSQKCIFVKSLTGEFTFCYKTAYVSDDVVDVSIGEETEATLAELTELERQGSYIIWYGKVAFSDSEGFSYQDVAYSKKF